MTSLPKLTSAVSDAPAKAHPSAISDLHQNVVLSPSAESDKLPIATDLLNFAGTGNKKAPVYPPKFSTCITGLRAAEGYRARPSETGHKVLAHSKMEKASQASGSN